MLGGRIASGPDHAEKCASVVGLDSNRNGAAYGEWTGERADRHSPLGRFPANLLLDEQSAQMLDRQAGESTSRRGKPRSGSHGSGWGMTATGAEYNDRGGPSRFFYCAKASKKDRGPDNRHPTVKPTKLTEYLAGLLLPPERDTPRALLNPYSGSGSEALGALRAGWDRVVGIEKDEEHVEVARRRCKETC